MRTAALFEQPAARHRGVSSMRSYPTLAEYLDANTKKTATCWLWTAGIYPEGYGFGCWQGKHLYPHRASYELRVGPIPAGYHVDHVQSRGCRFRHCLNPAHLEAVTPAENNRRSNSPTAHNAIKTHCLRGHLLVDVRLDGRSRHCRVCQRIYDGKRDRRAEYMKNQAANIAYYRARRKRLREEAE